MFKWFKDLFKKSDEDLILEYIQAGGHLGDTLSYAYVGEVIGANKLLEKLIRLEQQVADRGYRTISVQDFISYGGYGKRIANLVKREDDEPIYHALNYREACLSNLHDIATRKDVS